MGGIAQLVERLVRNENVRGSNPLTSTRLHGAHFPRQLTLRFMSLHPSSGLIDGALQDDVNLIENSVRHGANVNAANHQGWTPLMVAASVGNTAALMTLLKHGADVNARHTEDGRTPLIFAAKEGYSDTVLCLIARGARVNDADNEGLTPMIWAAKSGQQEIVTLLISQGADIRAEAKDGQNALLKAKFNGHTAIADYLRKFKDLG